MKRSNNANDAFYIQFPLCRFDYIDSPMMDKFLKAGHDGLNPLKTQVG